MYATPEEARSDLFLAGAVYLFGPLVLGILFEIVPLPGLPGVGEVLTVVLPLVTTLLVPFLLARYRKEPLAKFGAAGSPRLLAVGLLIAAPVVVGGILAAVAAGLDPATALGVGGLEDGAVVGVLERLAKWVGLAGLAVYAVVKGREAFSGDVQRVRDGALEVGRIVGIAAAVATVLLVVSASSQPAVPLYTLGVGGAFYLTLRGLSGPTTTTRPILLTPTVLLALGPFALTLDAVAFVTSLWLAALYAGLGLVVGMLWESRRSALPALGIGLTIALLTQL